MQITGHKIILVSASPRRRELLEMMGLDFEVDTNTSFKEIIPQGMAPEDVPMYFAQGKSLGFNRPLEENEALVSADTVVICEGRILGKPHDAKKAKEMLSFLSGKTHSVVSAVCVRTKTTQETLSDSTLVSFRELREDEIDHYIEKYNPTDKAGGYGIQEWIGEIGITEIKGSFYTVMGLPTQLLYEMLRRIA